MVNSARPTTGLSLAVAMLVAAPGVAGVDDKPIVLTGASLPELLDRPVDELYVVVFDGLEWSGIPFQVDERQTVVLASCLDLDCQDPTRPANCDSHSSYIFSGFEGGAGAGLDPDDEIVFMVGDARIGVRAAVTDWPSAADPLRYEIAIDDGSGATIGYAYLVTGPPASPSLMPPPTDYVALDFNPVDSVAEDTTVSSAGCEFHLGARWVLDGLAVPASNGGSGTDLLDRIKMREATNSDGHGGETEATWSLTSCFLGHKDGSVRVIREVHGAASGANTTRTLYFYRAHMTERVNLRVHPIPNVMRFVDYHSGVAPLTYFNPANEGGVVIDGNPDPTIDLTLGEWEMVVHSQHGGVFYHQAQPVPPPAQSQQMFWDDDATDLDPPEDDPGRYACHGIRLDLIDDTDEPGNEAVFVNNLVCLPSATGNVGDTLAREITEPPVAALVVEARCGDGVCRSELGEACVCAADCGPPPPSEAHCDDGVDDDCDGFVDAADPDCDIGPCGAPMTRQLAGITVQSSELFEACLSITAGPDFTVTATGDAVLRAGQSITLGNGVEVREGGRLVAEIDPSLAEP